MRFSVMTLFPEQIDAFLRESIIGRAREKGVISVDFYNIRDYADNEYGKIDDTLYGGGTGMLMECEPIYRCYEDVSKTDKPYVVYVSPKGNVLNQKRSGNYRLRIMWLFYAVIMRVLIREFLMRSLMKRYPLVIMFLRAVR